MPQRYFLPDHEEFFDTYTREELRAMLLDGELSRSDIVVDDDTGMSHLLGDLLTRPLRGPAAPPAGEPPKAYREFSADSPLPMRGNPQPYVPPDDFEDDDDDDDEDMEEEIPASYPSSAPVISDYALMRPVPPAAGPEPAPEAPMRELILHRLRPSWLSYPKLLFLGILCGAAAVACYRLEAGLAYVMTSAALAACCLIYISLDRSTTDYTISNKRVESETGIVGRSSKEVRICDIRAIDVTQSGLLALLGVGTVDFSSAGGVNVEVQFKNIRAPHKIKKIVRELQG